MSIKFVDFDWAGRIGVARYPANMNSTINWHQDVSCGRPIIADHDRYLVNTFFEDDDDYSFLKGDDEYSG